MILIGDLWKAYPTETSKQKEWYGMYQCKCGNVVKAMKKSINNGDKKSCGCLKHGKSSHRLWSVRKNMITRCYNPNYKFFKDYGGRGISVCSSWSNDFMSFYNWAIQNGYEEGLSLDRIDVNGNYEPSNCRFTTQKVQTRNTQKLCVTNTSGYKGVSLRRNGKYAAQICIDRKKYHLGYFKDQKEAAMAYDTFVIVYGLEHTQNFKTFVKVA